jgi:hypothetical protein
MEEFTKAHKGRLAIRSFKAAVDALLLRGFYRSSGKSGQMLTQAYLRRYGQGRNKTHLFDYQGDPGKNF